jgi:hypothetical protein
MLKRRRLTILLIMLSTLGTGLWLFSSMTPGISAAPIYHDCGEVDTHGSIPYSLNADQIERCFWHATQTCTTATLTFHIMGVDTGSTRTFWISPHCQIHESIYTYRVPGFHHTIPDIACHRANLLKDGLHILGCTGDSPIFIPYQ